jgi:hypothetical protein
MTIAAAHAQKAMLEPAAFQVLSKFPLHELRQRAPVERELCQKVRVVLIKSHTAKILGEFLTERGVA